MHMFRDGFVKTFAYRKKGNRYIYKDITKI